MSDTTTLDETGTSPGEELPELVESEYLGSDGTAEDTPLKTPGAAPVPRPAALDRHRRGPRAQHLAGLPRRRQGRRAGDEHRHHAGDPDRRLAHRGGARGCAPSSLAHDPRRRADPGVGCRPRVARPEPRRRRGRRHRVRRIRPDRPRARSTVEALASIKFNATEFTAPAGIVQFNYSGATGHTLAIQDPKFDGFLLTTDAGGPKTGKVELDPGQVHHLLHRARPRGPGHEGDAHRFMSTLVADDSGRAAAARLLAAVAMTIGFSACGGGDDGGGGSGKAYVEPKGASTETIAIEAGNFYFKPKNAHGQRGDRHDQAHRRERDPRLRVRRCLPGLPVGGRRWRRVAVEEDRPEAREVHLLLQHHRAPRPGDGRHAHRQVAGVVGAGTTTAERAGDRVRGVRAAVLRAHRSPTGRRPARRRALRWRRAVPRAVRTSGCSTWVPAEHRRERAQELGARHRADDAHVEQAVVHARPRA